MAKKYFENYEDIGIVEAIMYDHVYDDKAHKYTRGGLSEATLVISAVLITGIILSILLMI